MPTYVAAVLGSAPVAYFRFDDSGATAVDTIGRFDARYDVDRGQLGHPGSALLSGGTSVAMEGDGQAGQGTSAYVAMPHALMPWDGDFTVELWVRPVADTAGWYSLILSAETYQVNGFRFGWTPDTQLVVWTKETGGFSDVRSTATLTLGRWSHIALVKQAQNISVFLNGALVLLSDVSYVEPDASSDACLGSCHGMPSNGDYDELAIYDVALSAETIQAHVAAR